MYECALLWRQVYILYYVSRLSLFLYIGLILMNSITAKMLAQSASRALGLVNAKCKLVGGVPYTIFTKLYDSIAWPDIAYGAALQGHKNFSCITAVQNRATRFFWGLGDTRLQLQFLEWVTCFVRQGRQQQIFVQEYIPCTNSTILIKRISILAYAKSDRSKRWYFWM